MHQHLHIIAKLPSTGDHGKKQYWNMYSLQFVDDKNDKGCHFPTYTMAQNSLNHASEKLHGGRLQIEPMIIEK